MARARPIVAVLPQDDGDPRSGLAGVEEHAEVRVASDAKTLAAALSDASVLFVWDFRTDWLRDAWAAARDLEWIHTASAGVDAVLVPEVVDSDVIVTNSSGVFDRPIAEHVLGVLLALTKDLHTSLRLQALRLWQHRESGRLADRRVVVVGAGGVAGATVTLLRAAGMEVTVVGRRPRNDAELGAVLGSDQLEGAMAEAKVVVVAAPLTPATRGMFDRERFAAMRPGAWFVNVGRGPLVDEQALIEALDSGQVGAAALDVFEREPLPDDSPLWGFENVIITPHMSGDFRGWRKALGELFADNFARWHQGTPLRNVVDKRRGYLVKESR